MISSEANKRHKETNKKGTESLGKQLLHSDGKNTQLRDLGAISSSLFSQKAQSEGGQPLHYRHGNTFILHTQPVAAFPLITWYVHTNLHGAPLAEPARNPCSSFGCTDKEGRKQSATEGWQVKATAHTGLLPGSTYS